MQSQEASALFSNLSEESQLVLLAKFAHNLTIVARDSYKTQSGEGRDAKRLREYNEIQHRVLGHILALNGHDKSRYPDDALITMMLEHEDENLYAQCVWCFNDALDHVNAT